MNNEELVIEVRAINEKLDRILELLQAGKRGKTVGEPRPKKEKPAPLTQEETSSLQSEFVRLYEQWAQGEELDVQNQLESLDADALRRFADANNLNVTTKTPKQKVLALIGARFREKRQLQNGLPSRREKGI